MTNNKQQDYLNKVDAINHTPTFVYLDYFDDKTQTFHPGNKYLIGKYQIVDHRTVGSNEVIFELDFPSWSKNSEVAKRICTVLDNRNWPYNIFVSGGKGIHISMWFNKIDIKNEPQLIKLFEEAIEYRLTYKQIRLWLWRLILTECDLYNKDICCDGGKIDRAPINFDEETNKVHPIRCCGGRKQVQDKELKTITTTYKSMIKYEDLSSKKPVISNISDVIYPEELKLLTIDYSEFASFLQEYIKDEKAKNNAPIPQNIQGITYTELESVKTILEGLKQGQRSIGAKIIAIACKLDGFSLSRCQQSMIGYVNNCSKVGDVFTIDEANRWAEWVYAQQKVFWNCALPISIKVHDKDTCAYCQQLNKKTNKLLQDKDLLNRIDKFLGQTIVGEKKNRVLTFLLLLSSKFKTDKSFHMFGDPKPASIIFSSMSASGKSWMTKQILPLFGEEGVDYYIFSRMTKQSLNYFVDIDMDGKILFVEELQGLDAESNQLRLWISEGVLKLSTIEDVEDEDGNVKKQMIIKKTQGQPVFITGTAEDTIDEQMNNRSWLISLDVSKEQNKAILKFEDEMTKGKITRDKTELRTLQECIKELKPYHFVIPYFNYEDLNIPVEDVRIRRDYAKFRHMIQSVALLYQKQRLKMIDDEGNEYIICNFDDYEIAKTYCEDVLQSTFSGLTAQQIDLLNKIKNQSWAIEFEADNVQKLSGWSQSKTYTVLKQLEEIGAITSKGHQRGSSTIYSYNNSKKLVDLTLPSKEVLAQKFKEKDISFFEFLEKKGFLLPASDTASPNGNKTEKIDENRQNEITFFMREYNEFVREKSYYSKVSFQPLAENFQKCLPESTSVNESKTEASSEITLKLTIDIIRDFLKKNEKKFTYDEVHEYVRVLQGIPFVDIDFELEQLMFSGELVQIRPGMYQRV